MTGEAGKQHESAWNDFQNLWRVLTTPEKEAYWRTTSKSARDLSHRSAMYADLCAALKEVESGKPITRMAALRGSGARKLSADELYRLVNRFKVRLFESEAAQDFLLRSMCSWIQFSERNALNAMLDAVGCLHDETGSRRPNSAIPEFTAEVAKSKALGLATTHKARSLMLVCAGLILSDSPWRNLVLARDALASLAASEPTDSTEIESLVSLQAQPGDAEFRSDHTSAGTGASSESAHLQPPTSQQDDLAANEIVPRSLQELYSLIETICRVALATDRPDVAHGLEIRALLDVHLDRFDELGKAPLIDEVTQLIDLYCSELLHMIDVLEMEGSEQKDLATALKAAWRIEVVSALREGRSKPWFDTTLQERRDLPEFAERFREQKSRIDQLRLEIEGIRTQLSVAKYTARTALKASESRKLTEISAAEGELESIRVDAAHQLVPEGQTLDVLMEDAGLVRNVDFSVEELSIDAIRTLKSLLAGTFDSKEGLTLQGNSAAEVEAVAQTVAALPEQPSGQVVDADSSLADTGYPTNAAEELEKTNSTSADSALQPQAEQPFKVLPSESDSTERSDSQSQPHEQFEEGPILEPASRSLPEALRHLQYSESRGDAQQAFQIGYEQFSHVPGGVVEAVAMHWVHRGHLNVAYQILSDSKDSSLVSERVLDASLLRSAFYGMHFWPKDREALSYTQRDLNLLNHRDLEEQLDRKPIGKLVPYLLVCATLQPALFAGGETQAPTLLKLAANYFDGALKQLLTNVADFTMRGGRADLEALRNEEGQELHFAATKLREQADAWVDVNAQRTTRWHSLRVALKILSEQPVFKPAIEAIRTGEKGDALAVRALINTYSSHVESRRLLDELVQRIRADGPLDHIDSQAYSSFCQQVDSLVAIAQAWLLEVVPTDVKGKETSEFLERFHTQLDRSIASLQAHSAFADLEHRAGSHLLLSSLQSLQKEIRRETHSSWRFDQTDATLRLPETLARLEMGEVGVDYRLEWLATRLVSPTWLADMTELAKKRGAHWVRLLVLGERQSLGGDHDVAVDAAVAQIAGTRSELKASIEKFKNLSIQAVSVDELSEGEHLFNVSAATEWVEKLDSLKPFVDISSIEDEVTRRYRALEKLLNSKASELEEELKHGLLVMRTRVGVNAVPEGWDARVRAALNRRNLTVARELINQLQDHINRNSPLTDHSIQENGDLSLFLLAEAALHAVLLEYPNPREAGERVIQECPGNLDYSQSKAAFKDAIAIPLEWRSRGPNKKATLERRTYEGIAEVLKFAGFSPVDASGAPDTIRDCEYSATGDFRRLKVRIGRPTLPKGFPLFEDGHSDQVSLDVIFAQGAWSLTGLTTLVERHGLPTRSVLLVGAPLSPEERRALANFCRDGKCTIFALDPVVLSYLATVASHSALKTFLHVAAAWTFYNPYTKGDARQPAPPEMRFGREHDVASLVEPRGAALVYGGRQLGKTTLLHAAVHRFEQKDVSRNHAFYIRMDGLFQHAVERNTNIKERVFERLASALVERKLIPPSTPGRTAEERLQAEFQRDGSTRVLFCLDEIDSVLDKDARTNFQLVRSLVSLVNDMRQRFRVVFAGLNNVNRFRTYPNVPLEQLGRPLEVKILPAADARSLILQPLTAMGYQFEEVELVDRIMAFTNCHPSLLHIFCSELVEQIARERFAKGGLRTIRHTDLENVENSSDVRRLSGERFDMTLNLDKRYTVVVYGLLDLYGKSIGKFTVKQALDIARNWVPEEFQQMSESGFESLLQELVGLGVLREADRVTHQYAMRNQSILQLVGSANDVSHKLQVAIRGLTNHEEDVLTCHAAGTNLEPSPLSLQDERQILTAKPPDGAPKYSVSIIMGTQALGLSIKGTQDGFSAINEFESGTLLSKHETRTLADSQFLEPKRFGELLDTAIDNWTNDRAAVILVPLVEVHSIDRIMDLLSIANEKAARATRLKNALRVVFLLGARAMWSWHSNPWLTMSPNEIGGIVELNRWTSYACEGLLDQQGLGVTPEQAQLLHNATEGWHSSLMKFIEVRKKKGDKVSSLNDFKDFTAVRDMPSKEFEKFVQQTGMDAMAWSMPLAIQLREFDSLQEFSVEDLQTAIELLEPADQEPIAPEQAVHAIRWWAALRVIDANPKETSKNAGKGDKVTYRFTPGLQRAINERAATVAGKKVGVT